MAKRILDLQPFVTPEDSDYIYGNIKDDDGSGHGTDMDVATFADMFQFFQRLMDKGGITPNGLPDSDYNGFQLYDALVNHFRFPWKTYIPTLSADDGSSTVIGGFTGTATGRYHFINNILHIKMTVTSVATTNTAKNLIFSLPVSIPQPYNAEGFNVCKYYDGTTRSIKQVSVQLRWNGQGSSFSVANLDASAFGNATGGTIDFQIIIGFRKDSD